MSLNIGGSPLTKNWDSKGDYMEEHARAFYKYSVFLTEVVEALFITWGL